ncbi:MAG TPA: GNAT family N-acetyltransferase [Acidimicrobiales bacterium]
MEVRTVDPADEDALAEFAAVFVASDAQQWPGLSGFTLPDFRAFARFKGRSRRWELLAARDGTGPVLGVGLMEFPLLENPHSTEIMLAVHPDHRRRGAGAALVEKMAERALADGRRSLNTIVDIPLSMATDHPSRPFARKMGFDATLSGNLRQLRVPMEKSLRDDLREVVASAPDAANYRTLAFEAPWPAEFLDDECNLLRVMSTDEPAGDGERQAETWDEERLRENAELLSARGAYKLAAVAQHLASGRLVAMTELLLADDTPAQSWQMITVVHPDHRGHRLGLAVKLANLDFLAERAPDVRLVQTGNASVNAPMIAVNELMGFEVVSEGAFWQKHLRPSSP